jgi:Rad3-related DNA helicase
MNYIHQTLRPHQQSTLEKILKSTAKFIVLQAPTGSGKSFYAAQLAAWNHKVLACVRTKSLQQQYVRSYGFTELYGKANYKCLEFGQQKELELVASQIASERPTADLCTVPDSWKGRCKASCPYPLARMDFIHSNSGTLNYSKFLLDRPVVEQFKPEFLFLDEAHDLSDLVVDFSGIVLRWNDKKLMKYADKVIINTPQPIALLRSREYLSNLYDTLSYNEPQHPSKSGDKKEFKYWERLKERIDITLAAMTIEPDSWYVYSDSKHMVIKPLTARFHFTRLFDRAHKIILMSATIGKTEHFARELGLKNFQFIDVPNVWPAPLRPIEDLQTPKMGFNSSKEDWTKHSQIIAGRINECPDHWTGLVHSPSKWLSYDLANNLRQMTGRDIFIPDERWGTERAASEWLKIKDNGTICVSWHFWEGIDAGKDHFCCVAKVPFTPIKFKKSSNGTKEPSNFETARFTYDGKSGYARIANKMVQGLGRIRRGNKGDYGSNKVVCVADSNWKRVKKYIADDVLDAIV